MSTFRGQDGSLQYNALAVAEMRSWQIQSDLDTMDDSSMGDAWKTFQAGLASWKGTAEVNFDYGDTNGQKAIVDKLLIAAPSNVPVTAQFRISATKYVSGTVLVTGVQVQTALGEIVKATIQFTGVGALTPTWS